MIGACIANGRKSCVGIESDGSLMMNFQELATMKGLNLPIKLFIINNNGYASIRSTQRNYFQGRFIATGPEQACYPQLRRIGQSHRFTSDAHQ